jgi:hypothetical protein
MLRNDNVVSRPAFYFPSNAVLVFAVSVIPYANVPAGKWLKLFAETRLAFSQYFQHIPYYD